MASTINASTSSGIVQTADTSGVLQLQSNGTTIATISSTGLSTQVGSPTFSATMSTTQSISNATFTKVNFNTEAWDTNSNYNTSTYRFTPTVAGYYQVNCFIDAGASTAANRVLAVIYKNGSSFRSGTNLDTVSGGTFAAGTSALVYLDGSTDYIECYGYIGATTPIISPSPNTYFDACMVRSA